MRRILGLIFSVFSILFIGCGQGRDILIADFEGKDYGEWKVEGQAFGTGPAKGTLPNQLNVTGYEGVVAISAGTNHPGLFTGNKRGSDRIVFKVYYID